ncbi:MAG: tRNA pseudouridine(38-40) synthase TruA [Candidatus Dormibacteria bacterium]
MTHYALTLEYDGTEFHGWQAQPGGVRTVAGVLGDALQKVTGERPRLAAAGRTDSGAHSLGQVVSFGLENGLPADRLMSACRAVLPPDVTVVAAREVDEAFHARFSARRRQYRYLVENRAARSALLRHRAWHVARPLDLGAMREATLGLLGRHDLAAFGSDPAGDNTVRHLQGLRVRRRATAGGAIYDFELTADAFLYGMVRRIVGFLVEVGLGLRSAGETAGILAQGNDARTGRVAPAHGLYQLRVEY